MPELGRILMLTGVAIFIAGLALTFVNRIPGLGRIPGDFQIQQGNFTFYAPIGAMIVLSLLLTVVINLLARWLR